MVNCQVLILVLKRAGTQRIGRIGYRFGTGKFICTSVQAHFEKFPVIAV
jgi:hypothetical protein